MCLRCDLSARSVCLCGCVYSKRVHLYAICARRQVFPGLKPWGPHHCLGIGDSADYITCRQNINIWRK